MYSCYNILFMSWVDLCKRDLNSKLNLKRALKNLLKKNKKRIPLSSLVGFGLLAQLPRPASSLPLPLPGSWPNRQPPPFPLLSLSSGTRLSSLSPNRSPHLQRSATAGCALATTPPRFPRASAAFEESPSCPPSPHSTPISCPLSLKRAQQPQRKNAARDHHNRRVLLKEPSHPCPNSSHC